MTLRWKSCVLTSHLAINLNQVPFHLDTFGPEEEGIGPFGKPSPSQEKWEKELEILRRSSPFLLLLLVVSFAGENLGIAQGSLQNLAVAILFWGGVAEGMTPFLWRLSGNVFFS